MRDRSKIWFPLAVTALLGIIAYNVFNIVDRQPVADAGAKPKDQAADGSTEFSKDASASIVSSIGAAPVDVQAAPAAAKKPKPGPELVGQPGPRQITLRLKSTGSDTTLDADKLTAALKAIGPVEDARLDGHTVTLTVTGSLDLSELNKRLAVQDTAVVEDQFPLEGGLRLYASGMT